MKKTPQYKKNEKKINVTLIGSLELANLALGFTKSPMASETKSKSEREENNVKSN